MRQMRNLLSLWLSFALLTVAVLAQTGAAPAQTAAGESALTQAQFLLSSGQTDEAIQLLQALPAGTTNQTAVKRLLGLAYYQKNEFARVVESLAPITSLPGEDRPEIRQSVQLLGMAHYFLGHIKEALPYLEQVNQWAPDNIEIAYVLGISQIQSHNVAKARAAFARMFKLPPDSAAAHLLNAQMMIRQQFEEFAEKELQRAIELDPKLPQAHFLLGEMAIYRARIDQGIELLQQEIALNPAFGMAYYRLGEALTRQLKWDEAITPLQKSIWLNPYFSGPYIVLGKVYLKKGQLAPAEAILRRALQMDANNFSGHHLLAQVLQQANRPEEAKKEFELAERLRTSQSSQPPQN